MRLPIVGFRLVRPTVPPQANDGFRSWRDLGHDVRRDQLSSPMTRDHRLSTASPTISATIPTPFGPTVADRAGRDPFTQLSSDPEPFAGSWKFRPESGAPTIRRASETDMFRNLSHPIERRSIRSPTGVTESAPADRAVCTGRNPRSPVAESITSWLAGPLKARPGKPVTGPERPRVRANPRRWPGPASPIPGCRGYPGTGRLTPPVVSPLEPAGPRPYRRVRHPSGWP